MKFLRLNEVPILNFRDLQSHFAPLAIYENLDNFEEFAEVHCVPLPLQFIGQESGKRYIAKYLTKAFWHSLLGRPGVSGESGMECLKALLDMCYLTGKEGEKELAALHQSFEAELGDAHIKEKLKFIENAAKTGEDRLKAILLLAICELSEVDPTKTSTKDWAGPEAQTQREPEPFPYKETAWLQTGVDTYKFWYHDSPTLKEGATIQVVRVKAITSANLYDEARIELYSETGRCVQTVTLCSGEYRYCTVSGQRIIRFLPCVCVSDSLCVARADYRSSEIMVYPCGDRDWTVNAEYISSFCAGEGDRNFILVRQDGSIETRFYKGIADYGTRLQLEMVVKPVVEARICPDGYELLMSDGTTSTNLPGGCREGLVTLNEEERLPSKTVSASDSVRERAVSETGRSSADLTADGKIELKWWRKERL